MVWRKGNLHTHSLWSDGDAYPEMIVEWYRDHGYEFLVLSEHNILMEGEKWVDARRGGDGQAFASYVEQFGEDWVEARPSGDGKPEVRLKTLAEVQKRYNEPGQFLLFPAEEITDAEAVHVNAINVQELIPPQGGATQVEKAQRNINAVLNQRERTRTPMFPHLNHPNFQWAFTAEEIAELRNIRFFEIYNGHPMTHNQGDALRPGAERLWDIVLALRLGKLYRPALFGFAVDDAHHYHEFAFGRANPGRGWIMVRAKELTPESLIQALEAGDFYSSTGVTLRRLEADRERIEMEVEPEDGVDYVIQFVGTRKGVSLEGEPLLDDDGQMLPVTRRYSEQIGEVLAEVRGTAATYELRGDELYVRARVVSTRPHPNPAESGEFEMAWTQPVGW